MKIFLISDLHFEFGNAPDAWHIPNTLADVIVLAGDIHVGTKGVQWAIAEAKRLEKPIIYVMGNHEYYHYEMTTLLDDVRRMAETSGVLHLLENDSVVISGVRFLGCTLWTDYDCDPDTPQVLSMAESSQRLNDHSLITLSEHLFQPTDALIFHRQSRHWLKNQLEIDFDGPTVVVTHHAPSLLAQHRHYPVTGLTGAFLSDMTELFGEKVDAWLYGHTHYSVDTRVNGTHLVSNQAGYPEEDCGKYDPSKVIDVPHL